jgi:primosomal protein N'
MKITFRRASAKSAEESANKLKNQIKSEGFSVNVEGPAPCFYERFNGKFQWQIIIKAKDRSELLKIIKILPANLSYDIDPIDIL